MGEWKEYKLGEILDIKSSKRIFYSEYVDKGIPFYRSKEIINLYNKREIATELFISEERYNDIKNKHGVPMCDDILLTSVGTLGIPYKVKHNDKFYFKDGNLTWIKNVCTEIISTDYLLQWLCSNIGKQKLDEISIGSTQQALTITGLKSIEILLPSISTQKEIANILSSLDDKIDLLNRQNTTLEAMAETLFRHYFIDNSNEDWEEGKLGDEFDFTMGQSPDGESYNENGLGISMYQGNADFGFRFPKNRIYTTEPKRFAEKYETLISVRAPVGAQNMANEKCCIGRGVSALRYKKNNMFYSYTYYKIMSLMYDIKQFNETGTVFGSITKSDLENIRIIIPDKESIIQFQNQIEPLDDKIHNNTIQIHTLSRLRDVLLPKLMSNEIKL